MPQIDHHAAFSRTAKRVAVHARTGCGGQFHVDALGRKRHGVIAARRLFILVRKGVGFVVEHRAGSAFGHDIPAQRGIEQHVGQVGTAVPLRWVCEKPSMVVSS